MEDFLKGRKETQRFRVNLPKPKPGSPPKTAREGGAQEVVRAEKMEDASSAPDVDLVMREGVVRTIIVHLPDGRRLELECDYA
jgi:hypothetical protein